MSAPSKSLFTPLQIGNFTAKNRVFMAPLTRDRAENTYPTELIKEHYLQRAQDAGLIVTEAILVTRQGTEWPNAPGIWDDKHITSWKNITDAVHEAGGRIFAQLWHAGRVSHPDMEQQKLAGVPVYGPSAISARGGKFRALPGAPGYVTPTEIDDPWKLVALFKQAALNAKKAGFDGAELHGANGYLVHQFLDSTSNHRTDQWGGSVENRARFGLEVLKVIIEVFGPNVAIKISPAGGYNDMGMPLQETLDTFSYFITEIDKLNIACITLARYAAMMDVEFDGVLRATQHDVLEFYGHLIKNAKIVYNTGVTAEEAEKLISAGKIDAVSMGFNYITHPDVTKRLLHGKVLENVVDFTTLYGGSKDPSEWRKGYNDYPTAVY